MTLYDDNTINIAWVLLIVVVIIIILLQLSDYVSQMTGTGRGCDIQ